MKKLNDWQKYYRLNNYYHSEIEKLAKTLIPASASVIEFGCKQGELLATLPNKIKVGVEQDADLLKIAKKLHPDITFIEITDVFTNLGQRHFDYILISNYFQHTKHIQELVGQLNKLAISDSRIIVFYFNFLWKPLLDIGQKMALHMPDIQEANWLSSYDIDNIFKLEGFEKIKYGRNFLQPYKIPGAGNVVNRYFAPLPGINNLCLNNFSIFKPESQKKQKSVSIIIPARNEAGNMLGVLKRIPALGLETEAIFIEGGSQDNTRKVIKQEIANYTGPIKAKFYPQHGKGKGDAVRLGFAKARNEILMILDADLTVDPEELTKFYKAMSQGKGDLIMGSRLVYPMEKDAMRVLNYLGNKIFSILFSFLLGQPIKDTLCGTKVLLKRDYLKIQANRYLLGNFDPFGDFDLIFGASLLNMKIVEIPVHYKERTYGSTNISRFRHGLLLIQMVLVAAQKLKFR